jgi:ribonuclease HI
VIMVVTRPISICHLNTNRNNSVVTTLLNEYIDRFDIILLQEPWWGRIGVDVEGPVGHNVWRPILPVSLVAPGARPRVMAYVRERQDFSVTLRSDLASDLDIQVLDIRQAPHPTTTIINVYSEPRKGDNVLTDAATRLRHIPIPKDRPVVITGDFNKRHPDWSIARTPPSRDSADFVEWMTNQRFVMRNQPQEATWVSHNHHTHRSVLDLTFTNALATADDVCREWTVDPDISCGLDHHALRWIMDWGEQQIDNIYGKKWNYKEAKPELWKEAFKEFLSENDQLWETLRSTAPMSHEQLENAAHTLTEAMTKATKKTIPERRPSKWAKPWWTAETRASHQRVIQQHQELIAYRRTHGRGSPELSELLRKSKNYHRRTLRSAKREWADKTLAEASRRDIWGFRRWWTGARNYPSPALDRGEGRPPAVTHEEKCDALRAQFFKPLPTLDNDPPADLQYHHHDDIPHVPVTRTEVQESLYAQSIKKAPGMSQQTFETCRWAWETGDDAGGGIIYHLVRRCVDAGYQPKCFRNAIVVMLRKPAKPDYTKLKAYRPVQLLECMGKVIERVVAVRLAHLVGAHHLVSEQQFGSRPGSSTIDGIMSYLHDVDAARNHDLVTSVLTFDISGFYDNVSHNRLLREMRRLKLPLPLVRWTQSFCSERQAAVCLDGVRGEMRPAPTGVPQGSPASPVLAIIYAAELADRMKAHARPSTFPHPDKPTPTAFSMYVDDGHILTSSRSLDTNIKTLQAAYRTVHTWLSEVGLSSDIDKAELGHHSWKHGGRSRQPSITLPTAVGGEIVKDPAPVIRWLGVWFDTKLTFDHHVRTIAQRCRQLANGLDMLANTVRGLHQDSMRSLYLGCIAPVFKYAAPAWWSGKKKHIALLTSIQNQCIRRVAGAFRTTPIRALEIDTSIPPVQIQMEFEVERYANRLHRLSLTNPVIQRLPPEWRAGAQASSPPPLPPHKRTTARRRRPPKTTRLIRVAEKTYVGCEKVRLCALPPWRRTVEDFGGRLILFKPNPDTSKEDAAQAHLLEIENYRYHPDHLLVYSDGSLIIEQGLGRVGCGAAFVGYHCGRIVFTHMIPLGKEAEVFDAEMVGLAEAARKANLYATQHQVTHLHLFADSTSALQSIFGKAQRPGQAQALTFRHHIEDFLDRDTAHTVQVDWSPGHLGILGNEKADMLANTAARSTPRHYCRTLIHAKSRTKIRARESWCLLAAHTRFPDEGFAPANTFAPRWTPHNHFKNTRREVYSRMVQCRTGHAFIGEYYKRFNIPVDDTYCACGEPSQTRMHVLYECPLYDDHRHLLDLDGETPDINELLGTEEGLEALAAFLQASGAFTKTGRPRSEYSVPAWEEFIASREEEEEQIEEEDEEEDEDEVEMRRREEEQSARWAIPAFEEDADEEQV